MHGKQSRIFAFYLFEKLAELSGQASKILIDKLDGVDVSENT